MATFTEAFISLFSFAIFFSVQYLMHLYQYLKEWRQSPHWSISCFLALILPLSDVQGEITDLVGTSLVDNQLQTGQVEMPTVSSIVKTSDNTGGTAGKEGQLFGQRTTEEWHEIRENTEYNQKCHQGTQTDLYSVTDMLLHEPVQGKKEETL